MKVKYIVLASTAALLAAFSVPTFAAQPISAAQAKTIAEKTVPAQSSHLRTEAEKGIYEVVFLSADKQERYSVDVNKSSGKVVAFDSDLYVDRGGSYAALNDKQAQDLVTAEFATASFRSTKLDWDDGLCQYEIKFDADGSYGEYTINAQTGKILERDIRIGKRPSVADSSGLLSFDRIAAIAKAQVPGGVIIDIDVEYEGNGYYYEAELRNKGLEYRVAIDAKTGDVLWTHSYNDDWESYILDNKTIKNHGTENIKTPLNTSFNGKQIGIERAKQIALAQAPGAHITKCKLDHDDGLLIYEIEMRNGRMEYDVDIDALSGTILDWDQDYDD